MASPDPTEPTSPLAPESDAESSVPEDVASPPLEPYTAHYPSWARELARKYFTKTVSTFILHGDIRDVVPAEDRDGNRIYP
ncbi:MAG: AAA family ATPase, partial [Bacteroidetes bacterium QS_1_65_9]